MRFAKQEPGLFNSHVWPMSGEPVTRILVPQVEAGLALLQQILPRLERHRGAGYSRGLDGTDYYDNGRVLPPSHEGTKTHQERLCDSWWLGVLVVRTGFGRFSPPSHEGTKTHDDNGTTDSFTAEDTKKQKIKLSSHQDAEIAKNSPTDVLGGLGDSARYHCVGLFRRLRCLRW
jgi:hypothetical protein